MKSSLRDLKSNMKFTTVEQIDEAIAQLEHRVQHSSLTLNEEKKVLEDIRALTKSRAAVGQYSGEPRPKRPPHVVAARQHAGRCTQ